MSSGDWRFGNWHFGHAALVVAAAMTGAVGGKSFDHRVSSSAACASIQADTLALGLTFHADSRDTVAPIGVTLRLPPMRDTTLVLQLPSSDAGRKQMYENIVNLRVSSPNARLVPIEGRPDRVQLITTSRDPVDIMWRVRATARSYTSDDAHNHSDIGPDWAQIVGYDALILPADRRLAPVCATLRFQGLPSGAPVATSFGMLTSDSTIVARGSISDLRHAVYVVGTNPSAVHAYETSVSGGSLAVMIRGRHVIDDSTLVARVKEVISDERRFWETPPPPHYLVTIGVAPRGSLDGVRLVNAFVADIDSTQRMSERVQGLFAHELMHEWIGTGILHSASTVPEGGLYWFTEGFDDFLAHRLMHAVGLLSDSGYVRAVNRDLRDHASSPGRDSSWDALQRSGTLDQEPYARGELIALTLNAAITRASQGRITLDSLLRQMVRRSSEQPVDGFTDELLYQQLGTTIGIETVRSMVERMLAGGPIELPADALGPCMKPTVVTNVPAQQWSVAHTHHSDGSC